MADVSEALVREFFEARGFLVRQHRKFVAPGAAADEEADLFVWQPRPVVRVPLAFVLSADDIEAVPAAVVAVKAWHSETFTAALLAQEPALVRFADATVQTRSLRAFGISGPALKMLVVPSLPRTKPAREAACAALQAAGVEAVLPFRAVLADLVGRVEANRNYARSDVLQLLRILKQYDLLKEPQLELFRVRRGRK